MESKNNLQEKMLDEKKNNIYFILSLEKEFNLNEAIISAGDYGYYQFLNIIFLSLVWIVVPSIPMMLPYFRMMPNFICEGNDNILMTCTIQQICDDTIKKINSDSPLKTWVTDFNLYCERSFYFGIMGSSYFFGILFGNLFIAKFTDFYGRRPVLILYLALYLLISILTIFAWTYYIFIIVSFMVGIIYSGTTLCAFVLNFESSSQEKKKLFSTLLSMSYGIGAIIHIIIFFYFKNWVVTMTITSIVTMVILIFTFHLQESPEFLFMKKRYNKMIKVLEYIAECNGKNKELKEYLDSTNMISLKAKSKENNEKIYGIFDIIFLTEQTLTLLVMALNWFIMTMTFYGINFNVSSFGTNPYATGIIVYLSEIIAQIITLFFIEKYGFKSTLCGGYMLSSFMLILVNFTKKKNHDPIYNLIFIFLAKFGISGVNISNYIFTADMFPTLIRVAAMSFCSLMSRFGGISGTILIELTNSSMIIFGISCFFIAILLYNFEKIKNH
jgi:OCT family organic cation transporter-like MFS transporter 4/5